MYMYMYMLPNEQSEYIWGDQVLHTQSVPIHPH